uniref:General transcription factor IIH, polypeptide 2 n=1 Tax=Eptatretus burgeri TaxID=7764 RepID=A0A8C4WXB3_EPTBU
LPEAVRAFCRRVLLPESNQPGEAPSLISYFEFLSCLFDACCFFVLFFSATSLQLGFITTRNKRAEQLTELGGTPKKHTAALQKAVEIQCLGEPSLYNSLHTALQTLRHVPSHSSREVLVVLGSLTTCDPVNLHCLIKSLVEFKVRVSVIGLSAEVHICTLLAQETRGTYHVILDEPHFKELLMYHVTPPPVTNMESALIRMGFPQFSGGTIGDGADKPSFNMAQLESQGDVSLTLGGYFCPQCWAKYGQLPVECKICGLTLASAPHLARSYHHLFPLEAFEETLLQNISGDRVCEACQMQLTEQQVYICPECKAIFCLDCNLFIHESLHCCPGCIHSKS